jgi:hypothetical protein
VFERAIQITTHDFRIQEGLRTRERHAALVARGASQTMHSRHLTHHAGRGARARSTGALGWLLRPQAEREDLTKQLISTY